jgi:Fic family protein
METAALSRSPIGQLVTISGFDPRFDEPYECQAFLPDDLPAQLDLSGDTYQAVVEASAAVARADQAAGLLPNPWLLARPAIRREAVSTSALEGTYAALTDVLEAEFLDEEDLSASVSEVRNYVRAAEYAYQWVKDRPLTVALLEQLQRMLVKGTRGASADAGRVRTSQVFIGGSRGRVQDARFVPPPPGDQLRAGLDAWEKWMRSESTMPTVVRMAAGHYQFECLHPFYDGNGRIGRLIAVLQLIQSGELRVPVLNLSPWLEHHRREYQDHLLHLSEDGDFNPWIVFFSQAVAVQARDAIERVNKLLALKEEFAQRLRAAGAKGVSLRIADELIGYPMLTVTLAHQRHEVSYQSANQAVARLVSLGILRQRSQGKYDRIFSCDAVLRVIEG